jgi:ribosomal protein S14
MKILYTKDKNRRNIFSLLEKKKIILNHIINNLTLSSNTRSYAYLQLHSISKISTITKIKNRCIFSNRSRAIYRKFKLSRIFLKKYALQGLIMGVKKAS